MSWATGTWANASEGPTTTCLTRAPLLAGARARQACFRRFRTKDEATEQVDGARAVKSTTVTCVVFVLVSNWSTAPSSLRASVLACLAWTGVGGGVRSLFDIDSLRLSRAPRLCEGASSSSATGGDALESVKA